MSEAMTRCSAGRPDRVPDEIWPEAARYYEEGGLASLLPVIAASKSGHRLNITTCQAAGPEG